MNDISPEFTESSYTATALETGDTGKLNYTATRGRPLDTLDRSVVVINTNFLNSKPKYILLKKSFATPYICKDLIKRTILK